MKRTAVLAVAVVFLGACKGDPGAAGAQGAAGPQGPQGAKGDPGATGPVGPMPDVSFVAGSAHRAGMQPHRRASGNRATIHALQWFRDFAAHRPASALVGIVRLSLQ